MDGQNLRRLKRIAFGGLKNGGPIFFKFLSICMKLSFTMLENHPCLLCGHDFANKRLLLCQFEV